MYYSGHQHIGLKTVYDSVWDAVEQMACRPPGNDLGLLQSN